MKKPTQTMEEALQTFVTDECLSSSEEEVNLETEQDFTETETNFFDNEVDTEIEIEAYSEDEDVAHEEVKLTPDELAYLQFLEHLHDGCKCRAEVPVYNKLTAVIELARLGQTCTNDKQRETVLDIMWMCAMDRFIE